MMPPTSIDGTDITGATIDGTEVQEITVDGQTVFSAGPNLPVAYSNLVAWYPFDSATYGGSNADDVTAILGGSGDDTAYDGTVNGATYQSSGGVTDIRAGPNSGAFDFDGTGDFINLGTSVFDSTTAFTITCWFDDDGTQGFLWSNNDNDDGARARVNQDSGEFLLTLEDAGNLFEITASIPASGYTFSACVFNGSGEIEIYLDNGTSPAASETSATSGGNPLGLKIGAHNIGGQNPFGGGIDDFRVYNTDLSGTQIDQIYQNTEP